MTAPHAGAEIAVIEAHGAVGSKKSAVSKKQKGEIEPALSTCAAVGATQLADVMHQVLGR
jgi:hypothetical protein